MIRKYLTLTLESVDGMFVKVRKSWIHSDEDRIVDSNRGICLTSKFVGWLQKLVDFTAENWAMRHGTLYIRRAAKLTAKCCFTNNLSNCANRKLEKSSSVEIHMRLEARARISPSKSNVESRSFILKAFYCECWTRFLTNVYWT